MKINKLKSLNVEKIKKVLTDLYPETATKFDITPSEKLFSPYHIELPREYLSKIEKFNKTLMHIFDYKFSLLKSGKLKLRADNFKDVDFSSFENTPQILSCLDFHINLSTGDIKLIEANTNASGYLTGSLAYTLHDLEFESSFEKLKTMLERGKIWNNDLNFITDEHPEKQKMFLEFLLYQEFFKQNDRKLEIIHINDLDENIPSLKQLGKSVGVYNRSTDFYLETVPQLFESYIQQKANINPNPVGYDLLAHKDNLDEWSDLYQGHTELQKNITESDFNEFQAFLLQSKPMQTLFESADEGWSKRKKYFFKPSDSYGGKATYRGASISRKYFDSAWNENFLAQTYFPASKFSDEDGLDWKFDLRVYVQGTDILYSLARVYQGQITNFSTLGGGFAPVTFY